MYMLELMFLYFLYLRVELLKHMVMAQEWLRGATPGLKSGGATESARLQQHRSSREELPPHPRPGAMAKRSNPMSKENGCAGPGGPR